MTQLSVGTELSISQNSQSVEEPDHEKSLEGIGHNVPDKFGCDQSVNAGEDVVQTDKSKLYYDYHSPYLF